MFTRKISSLKAGVLSGMIVGVALMLAQPAMAANNVNFDSTRDCDNNAVVHCGAMNASELQEKYAKEASIGTIYDYFDISESDVANLGDKAVAGSVTKSGDVLVNGKVVAKDALTAGRHNMTGSTKVEVGGVTFYTRKPAASFATDRLDAFVVLKSNGQFDYAILASCGNPVKATNTVQAPAPVTPKPTPTPAPVQPVAAPVQPAPAPVLPATGPGSVAAVVAGSALAGGIAFHLVQRRRTL